MPRTEDTATGEIKEATIEMSIGGKSTGPITQSEFRERVTDAFALESPTPGQISDNVVAELCRCYNEAADYAAALSDALKAQAEKHKIEPKALRMYIAALCSDRRDQAKKVADDLAQLLEDA